MSSTASHPVTTRSLAVTCALATGLVVAAAAIALLQPVGAGGAPSATTVGPSASTSSIVTTQPLLHGNPAPGANQTTTTVASTAGPDRSNKTTHSTNYKVWGIVAALIAVAVIVAILTWLYWERTRPESGPPSRRHRWHRSGGSAGAQVGAEPASAPPSDEPGLPSGGASPSGGYGNLRGFDYPAPGLDARDRTDEFPVVTDGASDATAAEPAARESAATEPEDDEDEGRPGQGLGDESGRAGLGGRLRRNRSRYADIVITVPNPDDLGSESP